MNAFKNTSLYTLLTIVGLTISSCGDFLDENPKDRIASSNAYKTQQDAISAVNAIYAHLNSQSFDTFGGVYHSSFWIAIGLASDEMLNNQAGQTSLDQLSSFTYGPDNATLYDVWKQHYKAITLANIAIARIPAIVMDGTLKDRLLNEAKFLRGLLYFDLVRMFGKVPLVLNEVESTTPGATEVDEIYTQIIGDLTSAENLPVEQTEGRGRATNGAAKALLAKVHLTLKDYEACATKTQEVIELGVYDLWEDYTDIYKISSRGLNEAIFSIGFGDAGGKITFWEVSQFHVRLLPSALVNAGVTTNTLGWQVPTPALAAAYNPDDERGRASVFNSFTENVAGTDYNVPFDKYYFRKYWDVTVPGEFQAKESNQDFPLIRYADVLLMRAEALNELDESDEAHDYINMVRERAGLEDLSGLDKSAFAAAVLNERRLEFAAEGHRWFDLVRTNKLETLVPLAKPGVTPASRHYLFPIPQRERDLNKNLPQNDY